MCHNYKHAQSNESNFVLFLRLLVILCVCVCLVLLLLFISIRTLFRVLMRRAAKEQTTIKT